MIGYDVVSSIRWRRPVDKRVGLGLAWQSRPFQPYSWTSKVRQLFTSAVFKCSSDGREKLSSKGIIYQWG